jgi:hypothetical protein
MGAFFAALREGKNPGRMGEQQFGYSRIATSRAFRSNLFARRAKRISACSLYIRQEFFRASCPAAWYPTTRSACVCMGMLQSLAQKKSAAFHVYL